MQNWWPQRSRVSTAATLTSVWPSLPGPVINVAEVPEPQHGHDVWRQGFEMMKRAFPDLQAHIEDIVAAQDKVAVRLRFLGTHSGEFLGHTCDRAQHRLRQPRVLPHQNGLIAEEWICSDMPTLFRQLG